MEAVKSAALKAVHENNEIMTRVGAGTPMGDALRRFWMPALLSDELKRDGAPVRLRVMGEDLVSFRDSDGHVGIVDAFCPHKRAPLFFGRNEKCGLRCVYHGWKFNVNGECLDVPNIVPPDNYETLVKRMNIKAYDTEEAGGVVWVYMGPKEKKPALPRMEWMELPPDHVHISRWLQRSNWLQALEGELDSSHISFLHVSDSSAGADLNRGFNYAARDGRPTIFIKETDYGFFYAARRSFEDIYYWRVSHFMQPVWSSVAPASPENYYCNGRGASPVDDYSTVTFSYRYRVDRPLDETDIEEVTSGRWFPPEVRRGTLQMPNGYVIDTFLPTAIKGNDYKIDRELQRDGSFTGIFGINTQDRAIQETMPAVHGELPGLVDRSNEHLVASDAPVAAFRRQLVKLATDLRKGIEPTAALNPESYLARGLVKFSPIADFAAFLAENSAVIQGLAMPDSAIPAQQDTIRMEQMAQVE